MTSYSFHFIKEGSSIDNTMPIYQVAIRLNVGKNKLFKFLRENGILKVNNTPTEEYLSKGFYVHSYPHNSYRGFTSSPSCRVDEEGFRLIEKLVSQHKDSFK